MALTTTVESLADNKVRLHIAVPASDFEQAIDAAFRKLAHEVRIDGFRPGKAPRRILEARFGNEVAREQALRDSLPEYYAAAVDAEQIDVIAAPEIDITAGEDTGDVEFDVVVEVRPEVVVEGYEGLRVEMPSPEITDETVDAQVDRLRDRFADLEDSPRPLADGDYTEIDIKGYVHDETIEGLTATDYLYEVGSGSVVPKLDDELRGKRPGDILKFNETLPERFGERAGQEVAFQVLVKEAKRKVLPDLTDEWVSENSEFDTVDALRADARSRLTLFARIQAQLMVRDRVLAAAGELVSIDLPETLVLNEMERQLHDVAHRLEEQGIAMTIPQYLAATGQDQTEYMEAVRQHAAARVRADLALRSVVAQEAIAATDEELDTEIARLAEQVGEKPARVRKDLERRGALEAVRSDIARGKALALLVERAAVVDESGNTIDLTVPAEAEPDVGTESEQEPEA